MWPGANECLEWIVRWGDATHRFARSPRFKIGSLVPLQVEASILESTFDNIVRFHGPKFIEKNGRISTDRKVIAGDVIVYRDVSSGEIEPPAAGLKFGFKVADLAAARRTRNLPAAACSYPAFMRGFRRVSMAWDRGSSNSHVNSLSIRCSIRAVEGAWMG